MTTGPDQTVWFSEDATSKIGHIDGSGTITELSLLPSNGGPSNGGASGMAFGSDGALWMSHSNDYITRLTTSGLQFDYPTPTANASPLGVVAGPDGGIWYTEYRASKIARIDPTTLASTDYATPTTDAHPRDMVVGPDGALWFTESTADKVGKLDPASGAITEFAAGGQPFSIAKRSDGLWITYSDSNTIRRLATDGTLSTPYSVPNTTPFLSPKITLGPDNNLWFSEFYGERIGTLDIASGAVTETQPPTLGVRPYGITSTPTGVWFTEENANQVGFVPASAPPPPTPRPQLTVSLAGPGSLPAGRVGTVSAIVRDAAGTAVNGQTVSFAVSGMNFGAPAAL